MITFHARWKELAGGGDASEDTTGPGYRVTCGRPASVGGGCPGLLGEAHLEPWPLDLLEWFLNHPSRYYYRDGAIYRTREQQSDRRRSGTVRDAWNFLVVREKGMPARIRGKRPKLPAQVACPVCDRVNVVDARDRPEQ